MVFPFSCGPVPFGRFALEGLLFSAPEEFFPSFPSVLMDFDSDGDLDLVVAQSDWSIYSWEMLAFRNDGNGNFKEASENVFGGTNIEFTIPFDCAVADFNDDGLNDLFIAEAGRDQHPWPGGQNKILIQNDDGQLIDETSSRIPQQLAFTHNVSEGDIDSDGDVDIYNCNLGGIGPRFYINDGSGFFTEDTTRIPAVLTNVQKNYTASLLLDIDKDGDLDLVLGGAGGTIPSNSFPYDAILQNDGTGNFTFAPDTDLPPRMGGQNAGTVSISTGDFDNDGWPDLVMSTHLGYDYANLQLLLNKGDGTFRDETSRIKQNWLAYGSGDSGGWIEIPFIVDSNNDGLPDILAMSRDQSTLLFENSINIVFTIVQDLSNDYAFEAWEELEVVIPGDVDGDGDVDFVLLYQGDTQRVILR
jgi:hypothetical protein